MKNKRTFFLIFAILFIGIGGYLLYRERNNASQPTPQEQDRVQVVASFYPLAFFTERIGGNRVQVRTITPAGAEPHDYDPSAQDIVNIERSRLLVLNGGLESWGDKIKQNLQGKDVQVVVVGEGLLSNQIDERSGHPTDPHVWLDPVLAHEEAGKIGDALVLADLNNAAFYRRNQVALAAEFDRLDTQYREGLKSCTLKSIITAHAAFGYLAARYGLKQVPIAGISPDDEPSAKTIAEITDFAKKNNVQYVFFEKLVSPKLAQTIANEVGARTLVLDPLEGISDADRQGGKNYFTIMEENLKNLKIALECK